MTTKMFVERMRAKVRAFRAARDGNVLLTFTLALVPIVGFVGAAVDYSRANSDKTAMQAAVDATALMLSKNAQNLTQSQMAQQATTYFNALFTRTDVTGIVITPTYTAGSGAQLVVTGTGNVPTTAMKVMGFSSLAINASSTVKWGNSRLRVALVLDNTGSMAQFNKLSALKTATNNLLTQLQDAASQNGDVYVSIIPFVKDVNLDSSNYNATWIDWTDWNANNGSCSRGFGITNKTQCLAQNGNPSWTAANHSTWNGCIVDRGNLNAPSSANYDTNVVTPTTSTTATLYAAEQYSSCPQAVMGLNYDWSSMKVLVNNMNAAGNTNQAIGLQLGWLSLVGGGPFTSPAMDPNYKYQQVIILLTDGLNTQDRWYTDQSSIDAREAMTCSNVKAAGIILYTVQVNTDGDPTSTLLQNCASSPDKFFLLTSSTQIVTTFSQIGTALSNLRIAQ